MFAGKLAGFGVVDHQNINVAQGFAELAVGALDPIVHRVHRDEFRRALDLMENVALEIGRDVGKKDEFRVTVFFRKARFEFREDVEVRDQCDALVEIFRIAAGPEEALPFLALQAFDVDRALFQDGFVFWIKVVADNADKIDVGKKTRGDGEVCGGAAEGALYLSIRTFESIVCNRTNNEKGHGFLLGQILADNGGKIFLCFFGNQLEIGNQRMRQRGTAFAFALSRHRLDGFANDVLGISGVLIERGDDLRRGDGFVLRVPAIVICNHGDGGVADLRFARELRFGGVGHPYHVELHGSVEMRFGKRRKLRAFHVDVGSLAVNRDSRGDARVGEHGGKLCTCGLVERHMRDQSVAKERRNAPLGAVEKLVRNKKLAGAQIFLQRADGADGNDALNAEELHRVNVGSEIEFAGKNAMAAAMAG